MKLLHKIGISLAALAVFAFATPTKAEAGWFFHRPHIVVGFGYPYYYGPAYYGGYYAPYYGYYGPYYGGGFAFGGHGYYHGGYYHGGYRGYHGGYRGRR
jgi:hypothetical protein